MSKGDKIHYADGYKYQLKRDYSVQTAVFVGGFIITPFIRLDIQGMLYIRTGYAWDGASGPAVDTKNNMRASLVHDALSQLAREGYLDAHTNKEAIDNEFYKILEEDGMSAFRRWIDKRGLALAGSSYLERREDEVLEAP